MAMDKKLQAFATEKGLKIMKNVCAYGFAEDAFVMLERQDDNTYCLTVALEPQGQENMPAFREEVQLLLSAYAKSVTVSEDGFFAYVHLKKGNHGIEQLRDLWQGGVLYQLKAKGYAGSRKCMRCGESIPQGEEACVYNGANVLLLHNECADAYTHTVKEQTASRGMKGLLPGIAGAIIGAALGAALYFVIGMAGYVASITGLVTGFLCEWLYRKAGGPTGAVKIIVLFVALALSVVAGNKAYFLYDVASVYEQTSFAEENLSSPLDYAQAVWKGYIVGDYRDFLSWEYDLLLTQVDESEKDSVYSKEEFIALYDDPAQAEIAAEMRSEVLAGMGQGLLYSLLGGAIFIAQSAKKNKNLAVRL